MCGVDATARHSRRLALCSTGANWPTIARPGLAACEQVVRDIDQQRNSGGPEQSKNGVVRHAWLKKLDGSESLSGREGQRRSGKSEAGTQRVTSAQPSHAVVKGSGELHPQNRHPRRGQPLHDNTTGKRKHTHPQLRAIEDQANACGHEQQFELGGTIRREPEMTTDQTQRDGHPEPGKLPGRPQHTAEPT